MAGMRHPEQQFASARARKARTRAAGTALLPVALLLAACTTTNDTIVSGRFTVDEPVSLSNLTVADGLYEVSYSLEVFVSSQSGPVELTCTIADTTGRLTQLPGLERTVSVGSWQLVGATDAFELPDLTMGIRCFPDRDASLQVIVRDAQLDARRLD